MSVVEWCTMPHPTRSKLSGPWHPTEKHQK